MLNLSQVFSNEVVKLYLLIKRNYTTASDFNVDAKDSFDLNRRISIKVLKNAKRNVKFETVLTPGYRITVP